ncbi:MAG: hypothetical protein JST00_26170 [Deltaproteobacteria bacterium]|nr:hypothetical protein [Deltaproteobacteria bacterium]
MRRRLVVGLFLTLVLVAAIVSPTSAAPLSDGEPLFPGWPTRITDFYRVTPPPHFANYFEGKIDYAVKIYADTPINATLRVDRKEWAGGDFDGPAFKTIPVVATAGGTFVTVQFDSLPMHPCWGEEYRFTLQGTSAPVRFGRMSSQCTYQSVVTDSWSSLTPLQRSIASMGKVVIDDVTMTPAAPTCGAILHFSARVVNNTSSFVSGAYLRWSKASYSEAILVAPGASKTVEWQEPANDWFDDGSNWEPEALATIISPTTLPVADRVWTQEIKQSCILTVGLQ